MKNFLTSVILSFAILIGTGCLLVAQQRRDPFAGVSQKEMDQTPMFSLLPCDGGMLFAYTFSFDVSEDQAFWMLSAHMEAAQELKLDLSDKVYIIVFSGPKKTTLLTADFKTNEIEFREEWNKKDKFRMQTWEGDTATLIEYLSKGFGGEHKTVKGRLSEEPPHPPVDANNPCPEKQEV
ncbi:MAG: hypothetical protein MN733_34265 [Nitrososphaera sp.]|nr:hypothetical protein [Nitrososphaera sp.]